MAQTKDEIADLKEKYLKFFAEFPVQRAAADFIGRTPETIQGWQKSDPVFLADVRRAKAKWAAAASKRVRPDNLLANLYDETKPPKQEIAVTTPTAITINHVHPDDQHPADAQAG